MFVAKGVNQKLKMLYLKKIFEEETDDKHSLTLQNIIDRLNSYGVNADRKTLYQDFKELKRFGLDIIALQEGRTWTYHIGSRLFELPEVKLLVDSVQASKFINDHKSQMLISKLERLVSKKEAEQLSRQVYIFGRSKTSNKKTYYTIDRIYEALNTNRQISFHYFQWNIKKEMEKRRDGASYTVSPWCLIWDDENYYLVGYDAPVKKLKHYRVDKMLDIEVLDKQRLGREEYRKYDIPTYTQCHFGMYDGEIEDVTIEVENDLVGILIDRFGKKIILTPTDENHVATTVKVAVSPQFFGWIMALGSGVRITSPQQVVSQMRKEAERLLKQYDSSAAQKA
jgi:predicted DNA-binding transcriptional regulator YafY